MRLPIGMGQPKNNQEGLLLWCQRITAPYKNVIVQNFLLEKGFFHIYFRDNFFMLFCLKYARNFAHLVDLNISDYILLKG